MQTKLYTDLASWWPLLSSPDEYDGEAAEARQILLEASETPPLTLLELGSGGGNLASHLKAHFRMTLTDLSPGMLDMSRLLNPECEHLQGDMRTIRLDRTFDAVLIHDAIMYMLTEEDLRQAMETAFVHCRTGGVALFIPDYVRETFAPNTLHGGHDGDGKALRYLEWYYDPDETDTTAITDFVYILREGKEEVRVEHDRHFFGLFARADWVRLLEGTGFMVRGIVDSYKREIFVCVKK